MSKRKPRRPSRLTETPFPADARKVALSADYRGDINKLARDVVKHVTPLADEMNKQLSILSGMDKRMTVLESYRRLHDAAIEAHTECIGALQARRPWWRRLTRAVGL